MVMFAMSVRLALMVAALFRSWSHWLSSLEPSVLM